MFNEFPYTNFHELNLDWIIKKVKEAYGPDNPPEGIVLSVNGQDGNVILYQDAIIRFPDVTDSTWNLHRVAGGSSSGIQFLPNKAQRISGAQRIDMYDAGNPPPYPVTAVNGQTGNVTIQIPVQSVNGQTGVVVIPPDFQSGDEIMEFTQASDGDYWGLSRAVSTGSASIYLDTSNNTIKAYISFESTDGQTNVTLPLLTSADIPSSSGVVSINSKTGVVTLYGTDIYTDPNSQTTVAQDLAANANATNALAARVTTAEGNISGLTQGQTGEIARAKTAEQNIMQAVAILINGDTCATGAAAGQYVYLKDSTITGCVDGLYKAAQAIPANTIIDYTYLTAVSAGGLNSLNDSVAKLSANTDAISDCNAIADTGIYKAVNSTSNTPVANNHYVIYHATYATGEKTQIAISTSDGAMYTRVFYNSAWSSWGNRLVTVQLAYDSTKGFPLSESMPAPKGGIQVTLLGRNTSTGAIYAVWYDGGSRSFKIGATLSGNAPTNGQTISIQYFT